MKFKAKEFVTIKVGSEMITLQKGEIIEAHGAKYFKHEKLEPFVEIKEPIVEEKPVSAKKKATTKKVAKKQ